MNATLKILAVFLLFMATASAKDGPRTGYFRVSLTPLELLGEEGAKAVSSIFAADEKLTWQLSVPKNYDPGKPAGAMVFVGWAEWGGGKKAWNAVLEERNMIWIGLIAGGDKKPINERMLRAILAKAVVQREYKIDPDRYYLFGYSGGAHVAAMLATSKPEMFKGAIYYAAALSWGKKAPQKIDVLRQNRFVFMAGSLDDDRRKIMSVADSYKKAGVTDTKFVTVANTDRKLPGVSYFDDAVDYLDLRPVTAEVAE
jgi:poly(3-hydroxybutyrate) depolymerase